MTGAEQPSEAIHSLHVGKMRMKLCKGKTTIVKEYYSNSMQVRAIIHSSRNTYARTVVHSSEKTMCVDFSFSLVAKYDSMHSLPSLSFRIPGFSHVSFMHFSYAGLEEVAMLHLRHCSGKSRTVIPLY